MTAERQTMEVDIVCVGFGPATAGFLHTLSKAMGDGLTTPAFESRSCAGMPLQVVCYERADDLGFGVSGVVTRARAIRASLTPEEIETIPMSHPVVKEELLYLLDPTGASRRSPLLQLVDWKLKLLRALLPVKDLAFRFPIIPPFLEKHGGRIFSLGQLLQWSGAQLNAGGLVQIWPGMPVTAPLLEGDKVAGVRLADQGVDKKGNPDAGYMPGMDIRAALTVVADGPVGPVGQALNRKFGFPGGGHQRDWAVGMKALVELPAGCQLEAGTVLHTAGYPEPEIFGFLYVLPGNIASLGIFVPSSWENPCRNAYRYLQHWMQHPAIWKHLKGSRLRSWGGKSLQEAGKAGEPVLAGDGFARLGEGSGSTNILSGSGVDEAWQTGVSLAEGVIELLRAGKDFSKANLEAAYVARRRKTFVETETVVAKHARDGFQAGFIPGMIGMGLSWLTRGLVNFPARVRRTHEIVKTPEEYFAGQITPAELDGFRKKAAATTTPLYEQVMDKLGWPPIENDGSLLISHQDALLMGGKIQAPGGYADHVVFCDPKACRACQTKVCVELCSGQAITYASEGGVPAFDREKCVHCGACLWNCSAPRRDDPELTNIDFCAGAGGLHSAEN